MRIRSIASSIATRRVTCEELVERVRQASASSLPPRQIEKVIKRLRMLFRIAGSRDRYERGDGERSGNFVRRAAREALAKADLLPGDIETRPVCRRRSRLGGARHVELLHARPGAVERRRMPELAAGVVHLLPLSEERRLQAHPDPQRRVQRRVRELADYTSQAARLPFRPVSDPP